MTDINPGRLTVYFHERDTFTALYLFEGTVPSEDSHKKIMAIVKDVTEMLHESIRSRSDHELELLSSSSELHEKVHRTFREFVV